MSYRLIACVGLTAFAVSFAQGGTVAYWPMVMDPATGGTDRKITDAGGSGYALDVNLTDAQVTNTSAIAFSRPPNGPSEVTAASCVEVVNGTSLKTAPFQRGMGTQSQTSDPLFLAMGLRNDFTIEGYMYIKSLRHGNNADTGIVFSGVNGTGDWTWYLVEPTKNSNTRQVVVALRKNNNIDNGGILTTIDDNEILGGWHHYALVFKFNEDGSNSRWTFYLDGVNRGSKTMANRAADENVQHDRFLFGGFTASGANKVLDAKFAFWRVSDEALSSGSLLCHQAFATTVAYWPMNVTSAFYDDAAHDIVPDAADERNTLTIRDSTYGGVSWTDSDIGWTTPPNPDAYLAAAGVSCWSKQMIKSANKKIDGKYRPVFTTATNAPVIEATKLNTSFTIEGFAKFTELPKNSDENQMFVYNTLGEKGGWCWNLYGADANGNLAMKVSYVSSGGRTTVACGDNLRKEELLNVWNHYALTFTPNNGKGKTEWRFYLNGRLLGMYNDMPAYSDYEFTNPKFYISGAESTNGKQSLIADMTCWRVSNRALAPTELLCGAEAPAIPADALVWKGAADSAEWSTGSAANWTADGEPVAWSDAKDAYFDDTCATNSIEITGTVAPSSINVVADYDLKLDFSNARSSAIGDGCTNFVKRGAGIFELYYDGNTKTNLARGAFPIEVREGTLCVDAANSSGALGDATRGYEVKVYDHAKLWLYMRNEIGSDAPDVANESVFTVYTNGTFDMTVRAGAGIQAVGALDLLGGNFVAPRTCHGKGYLLIRNRLTLGRNPGKRPYVFPDVPPAEGTDAGGITFGRNTEFRVEDVTGDAAADGRIKICEGEARMGRQIMINERFDKPSPTVGYDISRQRIFPGFDGTYCKIQPSIATDGKGTFLLGFQRLLLSGMDVFHGQFLAKSTDGGKTWSEPIEQTALADAVENGLRAARYATVRYSRAHGKWFALGMKQLYENDKVPFQKYVDGRPYGTPIYVSVDVEKGCFTGSKTLAFPFEYEMALPFGQMLECDNGDLLACFYYRPVGAGKKSRCVAVRYAFEEDGLRVVEAGTPVVRDDLARGVCEPSLARLGDKVYMTVRSDEMGLWCVSDDGGMTFSAPRPWTWTDGKRIGNRNTQQHWMMCGGALFLAYTREDAANRHVFRNRAPIYMSQFDPVCGGLVRKTEFPIVPELGARLGNFCVDFTGSESWLVTAEWMQPLGCEKYGSDNSIWLVKVK